MSVVHVLGVALAILAGVGAVYWLAAAFLVSRHFSKPCENCAICPPISLLKPLHGVWPGLEEALDSFFVQDYAGPVQIVFGVAEASDQAIGSVDALRRRRPTAPIELVVDPTLHGPNRKVSNLVNMAARARHDLLVMSDADVRVGPGYLRALAGAMAQPEVGVACCLYIGQATEGIWSSLSAMGISYRFLPNVVFGRTVGLAHPCMGPTIALSRSLLNEIGGLEAFADFLAEDYEIGRAVRKAGRQIAIPAIVIAHECHEQRASELIAHELRWSRTVRSIDPAGHAGSVLTHPLPMALIAAALLGFSPPSVAMIVAVLAARSWVKSRVDAASGARSGPFWLLPACDLLYFALFLASLVGDTVVWQGRRLRIDGAGRLAAP